MVALMSGLEVVGIIALIALGSLILLLAVVGLAYLIREDRFVTYSFLLPASLWCLLLIGIAKIRKVKGCGW